MIYKKRRQSDVSPVCRSDCLKGICGVRYAWCVMRRAYSAFEWVPDAMPGVYRATDTVMPLLSGSIYCSNEAGELRSRAAASIEF